MSIIGDETIRALFDEEAGDLLGQIDAGLPRLLDDGVAADLARAAHTIKGSAGVVGLVEVHELAAGLEAALEAIDEGEVAPSDEAVAAIASAAGELRGLVEGSVDDPAWSAADAGSAVDVLHQPAAAHAGDVVVVDDSPTLRAAHERKLRAGGFAVRTAANGREALSLLDESTPDLVVTDLEMPVMGGFRLIETIRKLPTGGDVPILVISSNEDDDVRRHCMALGAQGYVVKKDLDGDRLVFEVDRLINR